MRRVKRYRAASRHYYSFLGIYRRSLLRAAFSARCYAELGDWRLIFRLYHLQPDALLGTDLMITAHMSLKFDDTKSAWRYLHRFGHAGEP